MENGTATKQATDLVTIFTSQQATALKLRKSSIADRKSNLKKLRSWIHTNREAIQQAIYSDFKKPAGEVDGTEIFHVLAEIKNALANLDTWAAPKKIDAPITFLGTRSYVKAEPKGTCLIISPWNYPFSLAAGPLVSALAAGNTAIVKPSEFTPHTSALLKKMVESLFTPDEVFVAEGDATVSQHLTSLPFDHIFFTGSPTVGKLVMKAAAENLTSVTLELGGKSPAFVTANARLQEAAERIAVAKFINCGQTCIAPDYILADEKITADFTKALANQIKKRFTSANESLQESQHYTRIVSKKHWLRLNELLQDALDKGAQLVYGGNVRESDLFFEPTIITNVSENARLAKEEIFGPILPIFTFTKLEEAIAFVNAKPKPLSLYVYAQNKAEQKSIIQQTSSGAVCINDSAVHFLNNHLPFGGVNNSGMGSTHGYYGFLAFSHVKPVMKQRNGLTSIKPLYPPYTNFVKQAMNWLLRLH
ncbi:MAG: aldehyde dehydrogenase family protein [Cyclobacteriaceae bacterium]|jgi:aldehyde dehydrogenase (NAD+)|nr:aldehyde dehydrogenase family protein [Cytophagales bacterium]MCZ8329498.1 aldehyde dehydrogenase family protein [Cyclobacteriaceae bacterium]